MDFWEVLALVLAAFVITSLLPEKLDRYYRIRRQLRRIPIAIFVDGAGVDSQLYGALLKELHFRGATAFWIDRARPAAPWTLAVEIGPIERCAHEHGGTQWSAPFQLYDIEQRPMVGLRGRANASVPAGVPPAGRKRPSRDEVLYRGMAASLCDELALWISWTPAGELVLKTPALPVQGS
jgi:hypothetical protein